MVSESARPELEELMCAYQRGDGDAARALVESLQPALFRFFACQMGDAQEAGDMLQEVWLKIHRMRHTYRPGEPVTPWVFAIARHVRVDSYRRRRRVAAHEKVLDPLPEAPAKAGPSRSHAPELGELLAVLPPAQREVILLLKVNGLSLEETARAMSTTVGAVKQKAHRAYERLRRMLEGNEV